MKNIYSTCMLASLMTLWPLYFPLCADEAELWQDSLAVVTIEAPFQRERPLHPLVYSGGRRFSTEDAYRYAGALGDVARMVRSYAGVTCLDDSRNDISVRGNSPCHLLWRIDGYEMSNPNHFATIGLTGSSVSLLNSNLIGNSDFLMAAFPAEFGNALSGVFDLRFRAPADDYRFRVQTGWNGFELGAEGPFRAASASGYFQAAYRYSLLDILSALGMNRGINPKYQDFTMKLGRKMGPYWSFDLLTIVGESSLRLDEEEAVLATGSASRFLGNTWHYDDEGRHKVDIRLYTQWLHCRSDVQRYGQAYYAEDNREMRYSGSIKWESRAWQPHYWQMGAGLDLYQMHFFERRAMMRLWHVYAQDEYRFSERWKMTAGARVQTKNVEGYCHAKLEPRAALQWRIDDVQRLAIAYGRHHQTQVHSLYLYGESAASNLALDFARSDHYSLSYDYSLAEDWRLKADVYYQSLHDIAVEDDVHSSYSALNVGNDFFIPMKENLVNEGRAKNYGTELTLEKFLSRQYYAMINTHLFRSLYRAGDGIWRSSAYDMRYVVNVVGGYQFSWKKGYTLGADVKVSTAGGKPGTPWNAEAYSARYPPYFRSDLRLFCQYQARKFFYEFAVDLQNLSNHKNLLYEIYDAETRLYTYYYQTLFSPMYTFRVLF